MILIERKFEKNIFKEYLKYSKAAAVWWVSQRYIKFLIYFLFSKTNYCFLIRLI